MVAPNPGNGHVRRVFKRWRDDALLALAFVVFFTALVLWLAKSHASWASLGLITGLALK